MTNKAFTGELAITASQKNKERDYWLKQLAANPGKTGFPYDSQKKRNVGDVFDSLEFSFPDSLYHKLMKVGNDSDLRVYIIITAGLIVLLNKYTGQNDIIVGAPIYKQDSNGDFINTVLALRNFLKEQMTFKELILQVKKTIADAVEHQNYPIKVLLNQLNIPNTDDGFPLFDIAILLENLHEKRYLDHINHNMTVVFVRSDNSIQGNIEYNSTLFRQNSVAMIARQLEYLLAQALDNVNQPISQIDILLEQEKEKLLVEFNTTQADYPRKKTIHLLFQEQVEKTPDHTAVIFKKESLSYQSLEEKANQLANYLSTGENIGPRSFVGILMDNSIHLVVAILGIIKAGSAYIPIDPSSPESRIKNIIQDARIDVLLSLKKYIRTLNRLQWECSSLKTFLCMDSSNITWEEESEKSGLMDKNLWEYIGETATDEITGGGWNTSYTGQPFSKKEMEEYGNNILEKVNPLLHKKMRVLEIGCASGITMFRIAPYVGYYYGTDISNIIIEKNQLRVNEEGHLNIGLAAVPAHEIDTIDEKDFDLVIINSVIQSFHGHNYLKQVIYKIISLMSTSGYLFIGDVMDQDLKNDLIQEMINFKREHSQNINCKTKTDWSTELFISRAFFQNLTLEIPTICGVEFSNKIYTIENELTKFRYDALIHINKTREAIPKKKEKIKHQHDSQVLESFGTKTPDSGATSCDLVYVIYTSGTTGRPKGVMIEHRNLVNYISWGMKRYLHGSALIFPLYTAISFDLTCTSIFLPLLSGNTITIFSSEHSRLPIQDVLKDDTAHVIKATPSHLKVMKNSNSIGTHLKTFIVGGEALETSLARDIFSACPHEISIFNEYGPTEATVGCMIYQFNFEYDNRHSIPIGVPIDNTGIYLLDKNLKPVTINAIGEIYISGDGLARGYLNNPLLTAERFIKNPFTSNLKNKPDTRMYKTGDLARRLPDGNIEFCGRADEQVKIRGYRIELEEIETQLLSYDEIKEAVVTARDMENTNGDSKYLCAYVVTVSGDTLHQSELREYLSKRLPTYMVPTYIVTLAALPLTPNGKINFKALPEPGEVRLKSHSSYEAPVTEIEKQLASIWEKVLGRNLISVNENFFMIGGDSIKTIQVASRLKSKGFHIEIKDIFKHPSISSLAPHVKKLDHVADQSTITGLVPLTPIQHWFFEIKSHCRHHFNQAVMLYSINRFNEDATRSVFSKILEHHDALRMTFSEREDGSVIQRNHGLGYPLELLTYDFQGNPQAVEKLEQMTQNLQESINIETGPLMKIALFHLDDGDRLLIILHHLIIDGVSWRILFEDIQVLFQQSQEKKNLLLPLKTDSFKTWAEQLSEYASDPTFLKEKDYWLQLENMRVPEIKKDFDHGEDRIKDSVSLSFTLDQSETLDLLSRAHNAFGTDINDILLSSLSLAVKKTFGHDRLLLALEGHGREAILKDIDINRTVGWFTSVYPVLLEVPDQEIPGEEFSAPATTIIHIKETLRRIPNKGIGYWILKYLTPRKHKDNVEFKLNPRVSFNYLGQFDADVQQMSFGFARESSGMPVCGDTPRRYDLDISGLISANCLTISITFGQNRFKPETIKTLLENYKSGLTSIIAYCCAIKEQRLTPSDLTYKNLSIHALEQLSRDHLIEDVYTLTPLQEGMLFLSLFDRTSPVFFEQISYRLQGNLDISIVRESMNQLFKRHDILRTVFLHEGLERPLQVVLKERAADVYYEDIRFATTNEPQDIEALVDRFKENDRKRAFDLSRDVPMRVSILRTHDNFYRLVWSFHHILMDGWCNGILVTEFFELYNSFLEKRNFNLSPVTPFKHYIQWLEEQDRELSGEFWAHYLESYDKAVGIPKIKTGIPVERNRGDQINEQYSFTLDSEKTQTLLQTAAKNQSTLNSIVQTVWGILLGRYAGCKDVVFGSVVSGRPPVIPGIESIVGLFLNTIPVRIRFEEKMTFQKLLLQVQQDAIRCEPHHYYPLADIQNQSMLKNDLLDHLLTFENYPLPDRIAGGGSNDSYHHDNVILELSSDGFFEQTNYDLNILIFPGNCLGISFNYRLDAFENHLIERVANDFKRLLLQVIVDQDIIIENLTLLSQENREILLTEFNDDLENDL